MRIAVHAPGAPAYFGIEHHPISRVHPFAGNTGCGTCPRNSVILAANPRGIGFATCRSLVASGCRVVLADLDGDSVAARAAELRGEGAEALAVSTDMADQAAVDRLAEFLNITREEIAGMIDALDAILTKLGAARRVA